MKLLVSNIQRFSLHDGPGVRTTVFFKGCPLHCPWCANPENISFSNEFYYENGQKKYWAKYYSEDELFRIIINDIFFYGTEGGVTFSGGEPIIYLSKCETLLCRLKEKGINIAVETSLFVPTENLEDVFNYVDIFFVDLKTLDEKKCKTILGGDLREYKTNIEFFQLPEVKKKIIYRIPLVNGINTSSKDISEFIDFIKVRPAKVEIFNTHTLGIKKYEKLNKKMYFYERLSDERLCIIKQKIESAGIPCTIIKM